MFTTFNKFQHDWSKILFILILSLFIFFSVSYSLITPAFEGNDESYHYQYIALLKHGVFTDDLFLSHNPLYYATLASLSFPIDFPDYFPVKNPLYPLDKNRFIHGNEENFPFQNISLIVHSLRFFSIGCGVFSLIFIYKISNFVTKNKTISLFTMAFVGLIPQFIWINSMLNNDVFAWLFSTLTLYYLLRFSSSSKLSHLLLVGLFTGLAVVSKSYALILYPIVISFFVIALLKQKTSISFFFRRIFLYFIISIASGSWFIIFKILYVFEPKYSDPNNFFRLAVSTNRLVESQDFMSVISNGISRLFNIEFLYFKLYKFLWGGLGQNVIWADELFVQLSTFFIYVSLLGLVLLLIFRKKINWDLKLQNSHFWIIISSIVMMFIGTTMGYVFLGINVRYTFPVVAATGLLFSLGLYFWLYRYRLLQIFLFVPIIFLIILNVSLLEVMDNEFAHGFKDNTLYSQHENYDDVLELLSKPREFVKINYSLFR